MNPVELSAVILALLGIITSLLFEYFPKLSEWYAAQDGSKGWIMLAAVVVVSAGYFGVACTPFADQLGITLSCSGDGAFELLRAFFIIATGNQLTYLFTK